MTRIANSDLDIFPLGLGGNVFGMTADVPTSEHVLDAFAEKGGNFIDTADSYSAWVPGNRGGESETIIGEWMRKRANRGTVVVATKVGAHPEFKRLKPDNIARAAEASLQRLQTDYIDLYYAHYDDEDTPMVESLAAFDRLVKDGKVRYLGISNYTPERIEEWMRTARDNGFALPIALQPQYSLVARKNYEKNYAPLAEKYGFSVFPYFALASGFLTGKYRTQADVEGKARGAAVEAYLNKNGLAVVDALETIAKKHNTAIATVALAWVLAKPTITAPLASATSTKQLEELMAAPRVQLSAEDMRMLDEVSAPFA